MIDAIKEIGEYAVKGNLTKDNFLDGICIKLKDKYENKKGEEIEKCIVFLNFNTQTKKISVESEPVNCRNVNGNSGKKYLWVGNFKGNKPQMNTTTNNLNNLLTKTLPLINDKINPKLDINDFFHKKEYKSKTDSIYYIKTDKFDFSENNFKKLKEIEIKLNDLKTENELKKGIKILIKELTNNLPEDVALYTIKIDNQLICQTEGYRDIIFNAKIETLFDKDGDYKNNFQKGVCSICGKEKETTSNATNLDFKFYNSDKLGFSSNLDGKFTNNYNICKDCYQYLMIGERCINENLRSWFGGMPIYILPKITYKTGKLNFEKFIKDVNNTTNSIKNISSVSEFLEDRNYNFIINYLFYRSSGQSDFKLFKLIEDVSPVRLKEIRKKEEEISNLIKSDYGNNNNLKIDMDRIYYSIPLKLSKDKKSIGSSRYLNIIDSIFSGTKIDYRFLINQFTEVIRIIKFERESYNISTNDNFVNKILQLNFLLLFIKKLNILNINIEKNIMDEDIKEMTSKDILNYWEKLEIYNDDSKKALFLLGYLIGKIGNVQKNKEIKNKPILNKINFQGMGTEKLIRLSNDIFEKLIQYKTKKGEILLNFSENNSPEPRKA